MAIMNATIVHGAEIPKLLGDYCSKLASLYNQNDMSEFMKKSCQESEATNRSNVVSGLTFQTRNNKNALNLPWPE